MLVRVALVPKRAQGQGIRESVVNLTGGRQSARKGGGVVGRGDGGREVAAAVAWRRGHVVPGQSAPCQGQGQLGLDLLLQGLVFPTRRVRHEPVGTRNTHTV